MSVYPYLIGSVCVILVHVWWKSGGARRRSLLSLFPGDRCWPIIGNALQIGFDIDDICHRLLDMWRRHGNDNFKVSFAGIDCVYLTQPCDIANLLSHQREVEKSPERNAALKPFFGESITVCPSLQWNFMRKLVEPSFNYNLLESRLDAINSYSERFIEKLNVGRQSGAPLDMYHFMKRYLYDVFCCTLLGVDTDLMENTKNSYINTTKGLIRILTENFYSYWRHVDILFRYTQDYKEMHDIIKSLNENSLTLLNKRRNILKKMQENTQMNNPHLQQNQIQDIFMKKVEQSGYILDRLILGKLANGQPLDDETIVKELNFICFTSYYTTSMTVCHLIYLLYKHPDVQRKIFDEQRSIFGEDLTKKPTQKDLSEMKYLDCVIKESMRLIPTTTNVSRILTRDLELKDGRVIPQGVTAVVYTAALFRQENLFPESGKFKPERFLNTTIPTFAFIPFSVGPRSCIAFKFAWMTIKVTLSAMLRKYEICSPGLELEPQIKYRFLTESSNGVHVVLKERLSECSCR